MANIELIKVLRERTGAGMMDCKHALEECANDVDKACDWLRERGIAKAAKKADRIAAEGLTFVKVCDKCHKGVVVEVNCETDFVAKADPFKSLVEECAHNILENNLKTLDEVKAQAEPLFADATVKLGEKLSFRRFAVLEGANLGSYIHMGGKISVLVSLKENNPELAKGLAMHIAANNPKYISEKDIPEDVVANETKIQLESCKNDPKLQNKPEAALQNIVKGKVHKVLSEVTLLEQSYLLSPDKTVKDVLASEHNEVLAFYRYQVGEGLEKRVDNFAEEVMAQAK